MPIQEGADSLDLGNAVVSSQTVVGSPAAAAETIIASITVPVIRDDQEVHIDGWCGFTAGTSGVTAQLKIRRTDASGTTKATGPAKTVVATNVYDATIAAKDAPGAAVNQVYVMTLLVGSGAAVSTVSAVNLRALIV
jgi:hypothetical protein